MRLTERCAFWCVAVLFFLFITIITPTASDFSQHTEAVIWDISKSGDGAVSASLYLKSGEYSLTASGNGEMTDFSSSNDVPWSLYAERIAYVTIEAGVQNLSEYFFTDFSSLKEVRIYETNLVFFAGKTEIPYTAAIYGHINSTAYLYACQNYPFQFYALCDFQDGECVECGYVCESHTGGKQSCESGAYCEACGTEYLSPTGHTLSSLIPEKQATCYSPGVMEHYTCVDCGSLFDKNKEPTDKETLEIKVGHDYGEIIKYVPPTCEKNGTLAHYECSFCQEYFDEDKLEIENIFVPATGHSGGVPTCTSGAICRVCEAVYTDTDKSNHSYGEAVEYDSAIHWLQCACGDRKNITEHSFTDTVIYEPTESEMGILESSCECGYKTRKYIPTLAPKAENCTKSGTNDSIFPIIIIGVSFLTVAVFVITFIILKKRLMK